MEQRTLIIDENNGCFDLFPDFVQRFLLRFASGELSADPQNEKMTPEDRQILENLQTFWPALLKLNIGARICGIAGDPNNTADEKEFPYRVVMRIPIKNSLVENDRNDQAIAKLIRESNFIALDVRIIPTNPANPHDSNRIGYSEVLLYQRSFEGSHTFRAALEILEKRYTVTESVLNVFDSLNRPGKMTKIEKAILDGAFSSGGKNELVRRKNDIVQAVLQKNSVYLTKYIGKIFPPFHGGDLLQQESLGLILRTEELITPFISQEVEEGYYLMSLLELQCTLNLLMQNLEKEKKLRTDSLEDDKLEILKRNVDLLVEMLTKFYSFGEQVKH